MLCVIKFILFGLKIQELTFKKIKLRGRAASEDVDQGEGSIIYYFRILRVAKFILFGLEIHQPTFFLNQTM